MLRHVDEQKILEATKLKEKNISNKNKFVCTQNHTEIIRDTINDVTFVDMQK